MAIYNNTNIIQLKGNKTYYAIFENVIKRNSAFAIGCRIFYLDETGTTYVHKHLNVIAPKRYKNLCKVTSG